MNRPYPFSKEGVMDAKAGARERFDTIRDSMIALSHRIHAHPELGYEEEKAASWLSEILADAGFTVEKGICDLPTAFIARAGQGPLHLAICAEYDCLHGIGHARGDDGASGARGRRRVPDHRRLHV